MILIRRVYRSLKMLHVVSRQDAARCQSPSFRTEYKTGSILATSAVKVGCKRIYGEDRIPFSKCLTPRSLGYQIAKAALIPSSVALFEFNVYMDKVVASEYEIEPFDWESALKRSKKMFFNLARRNISISILKPFYEYLAVLTLSAKTADRLSKDLLKSIKRKFDRGSRIYACVRISRTALWAGLTQTLATFTVDIAFSVAEYYQKKEKVTNQQIIRWLGIKTIHYSVSSLSNAAGYAVGSYYNVGPFCACAFEGAAFTVITVVLPV